MMGTLCFYPSIGQKQSVPNRPSIGQKQSVPDFYLPIIGICEASW